MKRMTAEDFDQELLDLYDFYAHGKITKREFLVQRREVHCSGRWRDRGLHCCNMLSHRIMRYAAAGLQKTIPDIVDQPVYRPIPSPNGTMARCNAVISCGRLGVTEGKLPAVSWSMHENRGLNPYIEGRCQAPRCEGRLHGSWRRMA